MKTFKNLLLLGGVIFISSCLSYEKYVVESDYSYLGKFKRYQTFDFLTDANYNKIESEQDTTLRKAISSRMKLQGFKQENKNPSLLVTYKVFYDDFSFQGYQQPDLEQWIRYEDENMEYDPVKYSMRQGTLLIIFLDRKKETAVWQGYASSLFANRQFDNDRYLKRAVRNIFDQYRLFADGTVINTRFN